MKTAILLGASKGIGLGCAIKLLENNHRVVLFSRSTENLKEAKKLCSDISPEVYTIAGDTSKLEDIERLFQSVEKNWGGCDVLVNSNGGPPSGDVLSLTDAQWQQAFEQHAFSIFRTIRLAVPQMQKKNWGRIITIASTSVKQPIDQLDLSNFIRPGLAGIMKPLSRKLAPYNINVHIVCPGPIMTDRAKERISERAQLTGHSFEEEVSLSTKQFPMKRYGLTNEIAELVAFLASDKSSYMTGNVIQVDGGLSSGIF